MQFMLRLLQASTTAEFIKSQLQILFYFLVIQGTLSIPRPKLNDTDEFRLMKTLFHGYNMSSVRPVKNSTKPVEVEFQMKLSRLVKVVSISSYCSITML